jgi:hypothetical protein
VPHKKITVFGIFSVKVLTQKRFCRKWAHRKNTFFKRGKFNDNIEMDPEQDPEDP